jgi:imidazole glycerol phosphate synthase subunit HisF
LRQAASETVFVPLTVGGGIREFTDSEGKTYTALDVASEYFRSGADKVSIGSDAVLSAEELIANNNVPTGKSSIEQISYRYGKQAVVVRSLSLPSQGTTRLSVSVELCPSVMCLPHRRYTAPSA